MSKKIIIIGAGGHGKVIADIIEKCQDTLFGFLDDQDASLFPGFPVIGKISDIEKYKTENDIHFIIAVGDNRIRKTIADAHDIKWHTAIHPTAVIGRGVSIGEGTVIMANAVINSGSKIGKNVIINTAATIDHDNVIEDYVHISPGVHLSGKVYVGTGTWIGVGASIGNNIDICDYCTIGAGAVVVKDIVEAGTYVGVPAKKIK